MKSLRSSKDFSHISKIKQYTITALATAFFLIITFFACHITPFGDKTLAVRDANIQYLDFFAYLKDILTGNNSLHYSLSNTLGDSNFALFTYYLLSPLNLLVLLFKKTGFNLLLSCLLLIKSVLASCGCLFFLSKRFAANKSSKSVLLNIYLSILFGCSQYLLSQGNNIMWIDGVYLLPFMLTGAYLTVRQKKVSNILVISSFLSIIFNWYTGAINLLFSAFWFLVELVILHFIDKEKLSLRKILTPSLHFSTSVILAIALSSAVLLPTALSLKSGRGSIDIKNLSLSFSGNPLNSLQAYLPGISYLGNGNTLYLFSGSICLLLIVGFLLSKYTERRVKTFSALFIVVILSLFYWKPLFFIFSLFKNADSYWFRYSYTAILSILFLGRFLFEYGKAEKKDYLRAGVLATVVLITLQFAREFHPSLTYYYCALLFAISFLIQKAEHRLVRIVLFCIIAGELAISSSLLIRGNSSPGVQEYKNYVSSQEQLVEQLQGNDSQLYRINQTSTRNTDNYGLTANYNEALAFGYYSISGYSSDPDERQRSVLESLGYRENGDNFNIVNTSIVGSDSLLGVKYILSDYQIADYEQVSFNSEKNIYKNKHALPLFYTLNELPTAQFEDHDNTFEYQNELFRQLSNLDLDVYTPLELTQEQTGSFINYSFNKPSRSYALYGNIEWNYEFSGTLAVGNKDLAYAKWLSPSVFYIPNDVEGFTLDLKGAQSDAIKTAYAYSANLEHLDKISSSIQDRKVDSSYSHGDFLLDVKETNDPYIYSSIPWNKGWEASYEGKKIEIFESKEGFMFFENPGTGRIQLKYKTPGFKAGFCVSLLSLALFVIYNLMTFKRASKES